MSSTMSIVSKTGLLLFGVALTATVAVVMPRKPEGLKVPEPTNRAALNDLVAIPRDRHGHFRVTAEINGEPLTLLVDTGASHVVLSRKDAERLRLRPARGDFTEAVETANGIVHVAPLELDSIVIGDLEVENVAAVVHGGRDGSSLSQSLLGMSFLNRIGSVRMEQDQLIFSE